MRSMDRVTARDTIVSNVWNRSETATAQTKPSTGDVVTPTDKQNDQLKNEIISSVEAINNMMGSVPTRLSFQLHEESGRMMVRVIDPHGNKVIKEIPPKEWLDLLGRIKDMVGVFIDQRL